MPEPIPFLESNRVLRGPEGSDIIDLDVYTDGQECISCWKLTTLEIEQVAKTGKIWVRVLSGASQPPVSIQTDHPFLELAKPEGMD